MLVLSSFGLSPQQKAFAPCWPSFMHEGYALRSIIVWFPPMFGDRCFCCHTVFFMCVFFFGDICRLAVLFVALASNKWFCFRGIGSHPLLGSPLFGGHVFKKQHANMCFFGRGGGIHQVRYAVFKPPLVPPFLGAHVFNKQHYILPWGFHTSGALSLKKPTTKHAFP